MPRQLEFGGRLQKEALLRSRQALEKRNGQNHITTIKTAIEIAKAKKETLSKKSPLTIYDALRTESNRTKSKVQAIRNLLDFLNSGGQLKLEKSTGVGTILREAEEKAKQMGHSYSRTWRRLRMYKLSRMPIETILACEIYLGLNALAKHGPVSVSMENGVMRNALAEVLKFVRLK